jgi:DNA polymerase III subunit chi
MTRIDFYFNADSKLRTACQLAGRALQQRLRVLIYAPDGAVASAIDEALSALPTISFARSETAGANAPATPVVIARDVDTAAHDQVLLNLHDAPPRFFSRFQQLIEIVGCADDDRQAARQRFRFYRDRGYAIRHHDVARRAA